VTVFRKVLVAALFAFPFLLAAGTSYAQDQNASSVQSCKLTKLASYDLTIALNGDLLTQVNIDGVMEPMLIDPNVERSAVVESVREDINVPIESLSPGLIERFTSVHGAPVVNTITIPNLRLGSADVKNLQMLLVIYANRPFGQALGVLGMDVLHNFDVEFDLGHGKLNLFSPDHCAGQGLYWTHSAAVLPLTFDEGNKFRFPMLLDGKTLSVGIGAYRGHPAMPGIVAKKTFGIDDDTQGVTVIATGPHEAAKLLRYPFHLLSASDFAISNPVIDIEWLRHEHDCAGQSKYENFYLTCRRPDLLLKDDLLGQLRLYFAVKEKKVYITGFNATLDDTPVQGSTK